MVPIFSHKLPITFCSLIHRIEKTIVIHRTAHLLHGMPVIGFCLTTLYSVSNF